MAKKKVEVEDQDTGVREGSPSVEMFKVEVLDSDTVINCHELAAGTIVELPAAEIAGHRLRGLRLGDVGPDDDRDVYNVHAPVNADGE